MLGWRIDQAGVEAEAVSFSDNHPALLGNMILPSTLQGLLGSNFGSGGMVAKTRPFNEWVMLAGVLAVKLGSSVHPLRGICSIHHDE
jgi:hypothetical protein